MPSKEHLKALADYAADPDVQALDKEIAVVAAKEGVEFREVLNRSGFLQRYSALRDKYDAWAETDNPLSWQPADGNELRQRLQGIVDEYQSVRERLGGFLGGVALGTYPNDQFARNVRSVLVKAKLFTSMGTRNKMAAMLEDVSPQITASEEVRWYIRIIDLLAEQMPPPSGSAAPGVDAITVKEVTGKAKPPTHGEAQALAAYEAACKENPDLAGGGTYKQIHAWIDYHGVNLPGVDKYDLPNLVAFQKYVSEARRKLGLPPMNTPRGGRVGGSSIVRSDQIEPRKKPSEATDDD